MKAHVIWWTLILSVFFFVKGCNYINYVKVKGVVVAHGYYRYKSLSRPFTKAGEIQYPIVQFRDKANEFKWKEVSLDEIIESVQWDTISKYNLKSSLLNKERELKEERNTKAGLFRTQESEGGFFFSRYPIGDSLVVLYERDKPRDAVVITFFNYWLTLPNILWLFIACVFFSGLHQFAKTKNY